MKIFVVLCLVAGTLGSLEPANYQPPATRYLPANRQSSASSSSFNDYRALPSQQNSATRYLPPFNSQQDNLIQAAAREYLPPVNDRATSVQYKPNPSSSSYMNSFSSPTSFSSPSSNFYQPSPSVSNSYSAFPSASSDTLNSYQSLPLASNSPSSYSSPASSYSPPTSYSSSSSPSSYSPSSPSSYSSSSPSSYSSSSPSSYSSSSPSSYSPASYSPPHSSPTTSYLPPSSYSSPVTSYSSPPFSSPSSVSYSSPSSPKSSLQENTLSKSYSPVQVSSPSYTTPDSVSSRFINFPSSSYGVPSIDLSKMAKETPSTRHLSSTAKGYSNGDDYQTLEESEPTNYNFEYQVNDHYGNEYSHKENHQDETSYGVYSVVLPDGRKQIVEYEADEEGFKPKISYEEIGDRFQNTREHENGPY